MSCHLSWTSRSTIRRSGNNWCMAWVVTSVVSSTCCIVFQHQGPSVCRLGTPSHIHLKRGSAQTNEAKSGVHLWGPWERQLTQLPHRAHPQACTIQVPGSKPAMSQVMSETNASFVTRLVLCHDKDFVTCRGPGITGPKKLGDGRHCPKHSPDWLLGPQRVVEDMSVQPHLAWTVQKGHAGTEFRPRSFGCDQVPLAKTRDFDFRKALNKLEETKRKLFVIPKRWKKLVQDEVCRWMFLAQLDKMSSCDI